MPAIQISIPFGLALLLPASLTAQVVALPAGMGHMSGQTGASQPFSGSSARYQQIHDATDLAAANGRRPFLVKAMAFRANGTTTFAARSWNVQLTMAYTKRTPSNMSTTFSINLGTAPTIVLPYTRIRSPAGKGSGRSPNTTAWRFPFRTPFAVDASKGNLCWQWQHFDNTVNSSVAMDCVFGTNLRGGVRILPSVGKGCTPTGLTTRARVDLRIKQGYIDTHLIGARPNSPAIVLIGLKRSELRLPNFCTPILLEPLLEIRGRTNANGWWYGGSLNTLALSKAPYTEMYLQYAYGDTGQASRIGLSDLGIVATPTSSGRYVATVATISDTKNSRHNDRLGRSRPNSGLVTLFEKN